MKKTILVALISLVIAGCSTSIPGLTSHTNVPLELKDYRTGMVMGRCPASNPKASVRDGRVLTCLLDEKSLGGAGVTNAGAVALDGRIVLIVFDLDKSGGFSQSGVLRALTDKFGPPARAAQPKTHIWTNAGVQLQLEEIAGKVTLMDTKGLQALHAAQAKAGSKDL
jgi:hypothetical protein